MSQKTIDRKTVQRVMALRKKGVRWPEILDQLKQPRAFIHQVRPLMKAIDPKSVKLLGPGSPSYGKRKAEADGKGAS